MDLNNVKIAIVGPGYVGLPLAVEFGKRYPTVGFEIGKDRVDELRSGRDSTLEVDLYDPRVVKDEARAEYGVELIDHPEAGAYDAIILAVPHRQFGEMGTDAIRTLGKERHILYDVKYLLPAESTDGRL